MKSIKKWFTDGRKTGIISGCGSFGGWISVWLFDGNNFVWWVIISSIIVELFVYEVGRDGFDGCSFA